MKAEETVAGRAAGMLPIYAAWGSAAFHLALAIVQVALFAPTIVAGQALDLGVFRVDGLGLVFGIAWCLGAAAICLLPAEKTRYAFRTPFTLGLMTIGALAAAYAREPLVLWLGWEMAGLSLWLALRAALDGRRLARLIGGAVHVGGWPLLMLAVLPGVLVPFAPPAGGVAGEWPWPVALGVGVVALVRGGVWPLGKWAYVSESAAGPAGGRLLAVYSMLAPLALMKMLVAAPWGPVSAWILVLLGTAGLVATLTRASTHPLAGRSTTVFASACAATAIMGAGLASGSPLAAAGAVAAMLCAIVWAGTLGVWPGRAMRWGLLVGLLPALWLIAEAALGLRYGLAGVALLPVVLLLVRGNGAAAEDAVRSVPRAARVAAPLGTAVLGLFAAYPQALVDLALRPAVGAMAGGVAALSRSGLQVDPGVGLLVSSSQEGALAAWPATGIALSVYAAWVLLYWLRALVTRFVGAPAEEGSDP